MALGNIRKMTAGNPALVSVNVPLSQLSIAAQPVGFVADQIMPRVTVEGISGTYFKWGSDFFKSERNSGDSILGLEHTGGGAYARDSIVPSKETFTLKEYGLEMPIGKEDLEFQSAGVDMAMVAQRKLVMELAHDREQRVLTALLAGVTTAATLSGQDDWNGSAGTSNPAADCDTAKQTIWATIGMPPNTVVMSNLVVDVLRRNPTVLAAFGAPNVNAVPSLEWLAQYLFGEPAPRILVAMAYYRSTNELDATDTRTSYWSDDVLVCHVEPNPGLMVPAMGYQMVHSSANLVFEEYEEDQTRTHVYRMREYVTEKVTLDGAGYWIKGVIT